MRDSGGQRGGADHVGGFSVANVTQADVFDEGGVDVGAGEDLFEEGVDHVVQLGVFEAALERFGEGSAQGEGDDHIVRVLLGAISLLVLCSER